MPINADHTQKIIERIRKLLAIAGDPSSPSEAENAMCKAQELLVRHRLTLRDVEARENEEKIDEISVYKASRASAWRWTLAAHIAEGFRCKGFSRKNWDSNTGQRYSHIMFLGREEDVAVAQSVFEFACIVGQELARNNPLGKVSSRSFLMGFAVGVGARLREQREKNAEWGIVLACDPQVEKAWSEMNLRNTKRFRAPDKSDAAFHLGYHKGLEFNPEMAAQILPA